MITIIIGTRTQSALRAAVNMAIQDGRRFDVVAPRDSITSVHVQLVERNPSVEVWAAEPEQVKRGAIPLRIVAFAQDISELVFLNCLRPDTDLIVACCLPSSSSAAWLEKLMQQEGKLDGLRVVRLAEEADISDRASVSALASQIGSPTVQALDRLLFVLDNAPGHDQVWEWMEERAAGKGEYLKREQVREAIAALKKELAS